MGFGFFVLNAGLKSYVFQGFVLSDIPIGNIYFVFDVLMNEKIEKYIDTIVKAKGGKEKLYGIPTDIIGFGEFGRNLALALEPLVTKKEICFFDLGVKSDENYHYFDFKDMFKKTELMIFTKELPENYFDDLSELNPNVMLVIDGKFQLIIDKFRENGFLDNIVIM